MGRGREGKRKREGGKIRGRGSRGKESVRRVRKDGGKEMEDAMEREGKNAEKRGRR